jgi:uncharacterized protein YbgA (DUF1722 family)/uncharacterized protein YbbK (DUF523 family)
MEKIRVGISSCLLGNKVRYDGGHKHDRYVTETLGRYFEYIPVCPEIEYGLSVPREAMRLIGDPANPRLVTIRSSVDHTEGMRAWAERRANELEKENLCGFIFKSKSPSSGMRSVKVYNQSGVPSHSGVGLFAAAYMKRFPLVPVEEDGRIHDPKLRENFIERVFVLRRWKEFLQKGGSLRDLIDFHTEHKLLILSHSPKHTGDLGRHLADLKGKKERLNEAYIETLMEALRLIATAKKNTNVLHHIMGYFKNVLSGDEKQELLEVIEEYRKEEIPLIVPVVLLKHYVRKYDVTYLRRQHYLNPHPIELMLRNHV